MSRTHFNHFNDTFFQIFVTKAMVHVSLYFGTEIDASFNILLEDDQLVLYEEANCIGRRQLYWTKCSSTKKSQMRNWESRY